MDKRFIESLHFPHEKINETAELNNHIKYMDQAEKRRKQRYLYLLRGLYKELYETKKK